MSWHPNDFVSFGIHASGNDIRDTLRTLAAITTGEVYLTAFHGVTFFESLFFSSEGRLAIEDVQQFQKQLSTIKTTLFTTEARIVFSTSLVAMVTTCPSESLSVLRIYPSQDTSNLNRSANSRSLNDPPQLILLATCGSDGAMNDMGLEDTVKALHCMISASTVVVAYRDRLRSELIEKELLRCRSNISSLSSAPTLLSGRTPDDPIMLPDHGEVDAHLHACGLLTQSALVGLDIKAHHGRFAEIGRIKITPTEAEHEDEFKAVTDLVVADVVATGRPRFANTPSKTSFSTSGPGTADKVRPFLSSIAVPVRCNAQNGVDLDTVGVLFARKYARHTGDFYGVNELLTLQQIANHLSLTLLETRLEHYLRVSLDGLSDFNRGKTDYPLISQACITDVPADFWSARAQLLRMVDHIFATTSSRTVTIRLLDRTQRHLIRFCASPAEDNEPLIRIAKNNSNSVNAWVARNGKPVYIRDTRLKDCCKSYDGLTGVLQLGDRMTVAECCVPLFTNGRLVGTLNLESNYRDAYGTGFTYICSCAEQIGLILYRCQRHEEQKLDTIAAKTQLSNHELMKIGQDLTNLSLEKIEAAAYGRRIMQCLGVMETIDDSPKPVTIDDTVTRLLIRKEVIDRVTWKASPEVAQHLLEGITLVAFGIALDEVLTNAIDRAVLHATTTRIIGEAWVDLRGEAVLHGGRMYVEIAVICKNARPIPTVIASSLYRRPIDKDDRRHIGALMAGWQMRSIGGDVFLRSNNRSVVSVIHVPMNTL